MRELRVLLCSPDARFPGELARAARLERLSLHIVRRPTRFALVPEFYGPRYDALILDARGWEERRPVPAGWRRGSGALGACRLCLLEAPGPLTVRRISALPWTFPVSNGSAHLVAALRVLAAKSALACTGAPDPKRIYAGSCRLRNDIAEVSFFSWLIVRQLRGLGRLDHGGAEKLRLALSEILMNAVEHGNCGLTYAEKAKRLARGEDMAAIIAARASQPRRCRRRVHCRYRLAPGRCRIDIRDEGPGFHWRRFLSAPPSDSSPLHGRGIALARTLIDRLSYNDAGTQATLEVAHADETQLRGGAPTASHRRGRGLPP